MPINCGPGSMPMSERILCIDDDPNILQAYQRALRKRFHIEIALGGEEALAAVVNGGPFAVVVSDMQMPGINGVEFLQQVKKLAPDTVRMMLTGNADQQTALEAVNEGHIFRFMTKPCTPETFAKVLEAGIVQYRLIRAERDLLSKTFCASVKVLTDVLSAVNPLAFGKASRVRQLVRQLCQELGLKDWEIEVAAMLSQIGCVSIPEQILAKAYEGKQLTADERRTFDAYPLAGKQLISGIPRLEAVAQIIAYQQQHFNGKGSPGDGTRGNEIPLGSRVLKVALDFDTLISAGYSNETALAEIYDRPGRYDLSVVAALSQVLVITNTQVIRRVKVSELVDGLTLAEDIKAHSGTLFCAAGQQITRAMQIRLRNLLVNVGIQSPIRVFVPREMADQFAE
ncbi:MAG: HD domain-containing phosphohydrolase [Pirellulaceae bacterium]